MPSLSPSPWGRAGVGLLLQRIDGDVLELATTADTQVVVRLVGEYQASHGEHSAVTEAGIDEYLDACLVDEDAQVIGVSIGQRSTRHAGEVVGEVGQSALGAVEVVFFLSGVEADDCLLALIIK